MTMGWDHPRRRLDPPQPTPLGAWLLMLGGALLVALAMSVIGQLALHGRMPW